MILKHHPFAACAQLVAVARGTGTLRTGSHGAGVRIVQGGLLDLGYKMMRSTQKFGAPDGLFGTETGQVVAKFQGAEKLPTDGLVGKTTLVRLDSLLAKKATPPPPSMPVIPTAPVSLDYLLGSTDPPHPPDPGAGPWNSRPTEASYLALRSAIIEVLPASFALVGDDAVAHMWHYLNGSGQRYTIDLAGMVNEVPSAKDRYSEEVWQAQAFVEGLPVGTHQITSRNVEKGYNLQSENRNWYFAIGGYRLWGTGQATVAQGAQARSYALDFTYKFYDRYNWDGGKSVTLFGVQVTDHFMGEFHRQGIAREFDCVGSVRRRFTWNHGADISDGQLFAPTVSERGA
jgi:peptidoglycan hydrolase-like protein with peptidoglycan-binding domain